MLLHAEKLKGVHAELLRFAKEAEHVFEAEFDLAVVWGVRTEAQQQALYAQGRTVRGAPPYTEDFPLGRTVTRAASAHQTAHGRGCAVDFCPVRRGTWLWVDKAAFAQVGKFAEGLGLTWGGRWPDLDLGHVELAAWREMPFTPWEVT